jgi:esterase/lipase superfamily enzyme
MIEVFFATNRRHSGDDDAPTFGTRPIEDSSVDFRVGRAFVRKQGDAYVYDRAVLEGESLTGDSATERLGSRRLFKTVRDRLRDERTDLIFFIHGFASTFASSMERGAELTEKYLVPEGDAVARDAPNAAGEPPKVQPVVLVFAWPSDGAAQPRRKYFDDREDAVTAGRAIARAMLRLCDYLREDSQRHTEAGTAPAPDEICGQRLHLVAHSMGNYALRHTLVALPELGEAPRGTTPLTRRLPRLFDHAFLMAADADEDAFEHAEKLGRLPELAANPHVYHSAHDRALTVSDWTKNNPPRLGHDGPRSLDGINDRIDTVDCQQVDETDDFGDGAHQYYRGRAEVVDDVKAVLADVAGPEIPFRTVLGTNRYRINRH